MESFAHMTSAPDDREAPRRGLGHWLSDVVLRRMFRNGLILLSGRTLNAVLNVATMALAVRALGLEAFGVLVLIHTYTQAIGDLAKFQSWQAVLRYGTPALAGGRTHDFQRLIRFTMLLDGASAAAATLIAMAGAWVIGPLLGWPADVIPMAALYGVSVVFMVTATPTGLLRLFDRFDLLATQNSAASLVRLIGAGIVFLAGGGLIAFLVVWFLSRLMAGVVLIGSAWREVIKRGLWKGAAPGWRGLTQGFDGIWKFVWSTNLNTTIGLGFNEFATLLTGGLLGPAEAGLYRIARQIASALSKPAQLLIQVVYPEFARLVADGRMGELRRLMVRSIVLAGGGAAIAMAVLVVAGPLLLRLIGSDEAVAAYQVLLWLGMASLIDLWAFPLEPALISTGRAGVAATVRVMVVTIYVPVLILCIHQFGLLGTGMAAVAAALMLLTGQLLPTLAAVRGRSTAPAE